MTKMDIGELREFLSFLKKTNTQAKPKIEVLKKAAQNYANDASLKGTAIDTSQAYYAKAYPILCDSITQAMDLSEERLESYINDFQAQVDPSPDAYVDADGLYELDQQIDRLERRMEDLEQSLTSLMPSFQQEQIRQLRGQITAKHRKEQLKEKLLDFERGHANFFHEYAQLTSNIEKSIHNLQANVTFNAETNTLDFGKINVTLLKDLKKYTEKHSPEIPNFDSYIKVYQNNQWILIKNGVVDVEATNLYNQMIKEGTLPQEESNATITGNMIEALKKGKDPFTGQKITKSQTFGALAMLVFYYGAGKYTGKKITLPKKDIIKAKKKAKTINPPIPKDANPSVMKAIQAKKNIYQEMVNQYDCSEIADDLYLASGKKGAIYEITPKIGKLNVEEYDKMEKFYYHTVYSDGKYVYDPRYSEAPILKEQYFNTIKKDNPNGINIREE
ncbi:T7SS effector LXG polymorphic toxin [Listeria ilorinensis]|uniref:T7SS effector LXG polymorphic toxin n=1 Tax=Listeria ilorinensis TaxID=2867439 RepID=UPI001EF71889|nr:T7SS effector LXG polymorphic toxin [Listeria ilorinensis]